jgi:nucleoside-diphosphate-sugar epimerase
MAKRILVTGAAGFIGSHVAETAAKRGYSVNAIDSFSPHLYSSELKRANWNVLSGFSSINLFEGDLCRDDVSQLVLDSDIIVNSAAVPGLMPSWDLFSEYLDSNVLALSKILECIPNDSSKKIIQLSTSSVYGKFAVGDEKSETLPASPYGVTKLAAENLLKVVAEKKNLNFNILRLFSVYGPRQRPDMAIRIILQKLMTGETIDIYGDGTASRSNTYVSDVVDAILLASESSRKSETYNISGSEEFSLNEVLNILENVTGRKANLRFASNRPGDQSVTKGDYTKASRHLGYFPSVTLHEGLELEFEWLLRNPV